MTRQVTSLSCIEKTVGPEWNGTSGNWDSQRTPIDRIIIHTMVGTAASANTRFNNPTSMVSAHYGVLLDGSLWHWVDEDNTAYHSGELVMNRRSIGIEHEDGWSGPPEIEPTRPDILYTTSAKLVADICKFYNIPCDRTHILKHGEVHATSCPDALDIERIVREAKAILTPIPEPNPGYAPSFEGQDVTVNGIHYKAYKDTNGILLWKIEPPPPSAPPAPSPAPLPPTPPSPPAPMPVVDYKLYLKRIKDIMYGKGFFWNKLSGVKKVISESGV